MSTRTALLLGATVVVLLFVDFLTFHDLWETHTAKDWLILAASILAVACLAAEAVSRLSDGHGRLRWRG